MSYIPATPAELIHALTMVDTGVYRARVLDLIRKQCPAMIAARLGNGALIDDGLTPSKLFTKNEFEMIDGIAARKLPAMRAMQEIAQEWLESQGISSKLALEHLNKGVST